MHSPEKIEERQINNAEVSYRIVCCGEKCSPETCQPHAHKCEDSWHTMQIADDDHEAQLELRKSEVAARHEKMKLWREKHGK